jgi:DNA primase
LIPDSIYRNVYIKECSSLLDTPEQILVNELNKIIRKKYKKDQQSRQDYIPDAEPEAVPQPKDVDYTNSEFQEKEIIRLLLQYGKEEIILKKEVEIAEGMHREEEITVSVGKYLVNAIKADDLCFNNAVYQMIFDEYYKLLMQGLNPDEKDFINHEMEQVRSMVADLLSTPYSLSDNWEKNKIYVSVETSKINMLVDSSLLSFKIKKIESQISALQQKIKDKPLETDLEFLLKEMKGLKNISRKFNSDLSRIITH